MSMRRCRNIQTGDIVDMVLTLLIAKEVLDAFKVGTLSCEVASRVRANHKQAHGSLFKMVERSLRSTAYLRNS